MLFGWKRPDGTRRFREAYLEVPKKNGKSTLLAALAIYGLFAEAGAEVYPGAVDRAQGGIIFAECAKMIGASPALKKHLEVIESKKRIVFRKNNAFLMVLSADVPSKDGLNSSFTILDELHRFKSPALYDVMKYAGAARDEPILVIITTAGHDRKSICYELHERALAAIGGTVEGGDLEFLPVIYAADPEKDDLDDPLTWMKANPSMGKVLKVEDFARDHKQAKLLPRLWAAFLRLRLNIWTEQVTRWIPLDRWDALKDDARQWDLDGAQCYAALDLSSTTDLTSLSLTFPVEGSGYLTRSHFFVPSETAETRARHDKVPYPTWIQQGHIISTDGNATDHDAIRVFLGDLATRHEIVRIGLDPWNAHQLAHQLVDDGFDVVFIRQGFGSLSGPSKHLERLILAGTIRHDGNPCLRWNVANVAVETDASGNIKPSKKRSAERIDGVVSTIMSVGLATGDAPPPEVGFIQIGPPS